MTAKTESKYDFSNKLLFVIVFFLLISYFMSLGASLHWALDLFSHFTHQYFIGGIILMTILFIRKNFILASIALIVTGLSFYEIIDHLDVVTPPPHVEEAQIFTIAHYNRRYKIRDHSNLKTWLSHENPDIFIIQEAHDTHSNEIRKLTSFHPYQIHEPRKNAFGLILASRYPIIKSKTHKTKRYALDNFYVHALIQLPNKEIISLYTSHPPPPTSAALQKQRNEDINDVAIAIQNDPYKNIIFAGDFNITPYSPYFSELLKKTSLKNQHTSYYPFPTWPSTFKSPAFQIPIDHILHKGDITLIDKKRGPHMDSDHFPVIAKFAL